ncbi:cytochrome P450 [Stereum hirsutum FP-91666 SS1]|uniref:cytochrome P450 n=1 Tax=Stereum hirsutum (strain FP-91666) TaxID=721885 RepID=UPI000444A1C6|nr:cytochrome P450 [Stereum hirsutum FP-91666 SS1]EIM84926.1 cytochrome P450 [Stereum hirsutum FP-91666 SS1]
MSLALQVLLGLLSLPLQFLLFVAVRVIRQYVRQASLHDIPGPKRDSLISGNIKTLFGLNSWQFHSRIAKTYGKVVKIWGLFWDTQLYVWDTKALYHILIKDQYIFEESEVFLKSNAAIFGLGLLSTLGEHHRRQRKLLNTVFSIKHMRYMLPTFYKISDQLVDVLQDKLASRSAEIDVLEWNTRVALELIGQGGLGYSFNSLDENSENRYSSALKNLIPTTTKLNVFRQLFPWVSDLGTTTMRRWVARNIPWPDFNRLAYLTDIIDETSREILGSKMAALEKGDDAVVHQVGEGRDILSVLLKANMEASEQDRLPEEEILGQISTLTFAAMDTTSSALSRILHLLSQRQELQERLRAELVDARKAADGNLDYEHLMGLPFLEAVCRETLRLYPPIAQIPRTTRKDVILPLGSPITIKGNLVSELFIPKNTNIIVSILAVNRDVDIWGPDAGEWKPERWLAPLPENVINAGIPGVYANTLTFLGGGRACIGFKFSELEMKVVLSCLIMNFKYSPSEKETHIEWKSSSIAAPFLDGRPSLPLIVSAM